MAIRNIIAGLLLSSVVFWAPVVSAQSGAWLCRADASSTFTWGDQNYGFCVAPGGSTVIGVSRWPLEDPVNQMGSYVVNQAYTVSGCPQVACTALLFNCLKNQSCEGNVAWSQVPFNDASGLVTTRAPNGRVINGTFMNCYCPAWPAGPS
jgi:hypothetical protein